MMTRKAVFIALVLFLIPASFTVSANAQKKEFGLIANHLKSKYQAKKVNIPFLFLARFAVGIIRPAGVKSFNVTLFNGLRFSEESLDVEMQQAMRESFGTEWSAVFHVRSRGGQQAYVYMREQGKNINLAVVTVEKERAAVIRATFNSDKLADFINDPKIFGISLRSDGDNDPEQKQVKPPGSSRSDSGQN